MSEAASSTIDTRRCLTSAASPSDFSSDLSLPILKPENINQLPAESLLHIFSFLDTYTQKKASRVCVSWRELMKSPTILSVVKVQCGRQINEKKMSKIPRTKSKASPLDDDTFNTFVSLYTKKIIYTSHESIYRLPREDDVDEDWVREVDEKGCKTEGCGCQMAFLGPQLLPLVKNMENGKLLTPHQTVIFEDVRTTFPHFMFAKFWESPEIGLTLVLKNVLFNDVCTAFKLGVGETGLQFRGYDVMVTKEAVHFLAGESLEESDRKVWAVIEKNVKELTNKERRHLKALWRVEVEKPREFSLPAYKILQLREPMYGKGLGRKTLKDVDLWSLKTTTRQELLAYMTQNEEMERDMFDNAINLAFEAVISGFKDGDNSDNDENKEEEGAEDAEVQSESDEEKMPPLIPPPPQNPAPYADAQMFALLEQMIGL